MILDKSLELSTAQTVTGSAASTNIIDLGQSRDIGAGEPLQLVISVVETATAAGAATVTFEVQTDTVATFASPTTLIRSAEISKDALTQGASPFQVAVPRGVERYLRLFYTVGTGPLTAGRFTATIAHTRQDNVSYPGNV